MSLLQRNNSAALQNRQRCERALDRALVTIAGWLGGHKRALDEMETFIDTIEELQPAKCEEEFRYLYALLLARHGRYGKARTQVDLTKPSDGQEPVDSTATRRCVQARIEGLAGDTPNYFINVRSAWWESRTRGTPTVRAHVIGLYAEALKTIGEHEAANWAKSVNKDLLAEIHRQHSYEDPIERLLWQCIEKLGGQ